MKQAWLGVVMSVGLFFGNLGRANAAPNDHAIVEARQHFDDGTKAFNLGEFDRAVREYKAAYNAKPDPVFLYNIGQAYRLANDFAQALFFYRSFLRNQANAPNRREIEDRIHQLETQIAQQKIITTAPPTGTVDPAPTTAPAVKPIESAPVAPVIVPATSAIAGSTANTTDASLRAPPPGRPKPVYKKGWFWGVVVGAVVVVGVGVGLGVGLTRGDGVPSSGLGNQKVFLLGGAR